MEPIMQFFAYKDRPQHERPTAEGYYRQAVNLVEKLPRNPERTVALRKLLESRDAALRAIAFKEVSA